MKHKAHYYRLVFLMCVFVALIISCSYDRTSGPVSSAARIEILESAGDESLAFNLTVGDETDTDGTLHRPISTIDFALPYPDLVVITFYDVSGVPTEIFRDHVEAGFHSIPFNLAEFSSGVYLTVLRTGGGLWNSKKFLLIK